MLTPIFLAVLSATPAPALPASLRLEPVQGSETAVVFRLVNGGDAPLRVAMHRGLLSLEIQAQAPGRRRPTKVRCTPPAGARPGAIDPERVSELAPRGSRAEVVDLRWFCWSARARKALGTPGASVVARYGFRGRASARHWALSSAAGDVRIASLEAEPLTLATPAAATPAPGPAPALTLSVVPEHIDAGSGRSAAATVRLQNTSPDDVRVYVRPELFHFDVRGPTEAVRCSLVRPLRAPMRESFSRLAPRRRTSLTLDLAAVCPDDTFATPGVYDVEPVFEADEDGARVGLRAVTGTIVGAPFAVRVGRGDLPAYEPQEPPR